MKPYRLIRLAVVSLFVAVSACGQAVPEISAAAEPPAEDEARAARTMALELCEGPGRRIAEESATISELESALASSAGNVAEWQETRYAEIANARSESRWRDTPPDLFTAVCYFDVSSVSAPRGPLYPTTDPETGKEIQAPLPPYDQVVVVVTEDGQTQLYEARRSWMQEGPDAPPKAPENSVEANGSPP